MGAFALSRARSTQLFGASLDVAESELQAADWVPFRAVLGIPGAAIMLSHVALNAADAGFSQGRAGQPSPVLKPDRPTRDAPKMPKRRGKLSERACEQAAYHATRRWVRLPWIGWFLWKIQRADLRWL